MIVVCKVEGIEQSIPSLNVGDRFPTYLENVIYYIKCQTANNRVHAPNLFDCNAIKSEFLLYKELCVKLLNRPFFVDWLTLTAAILTA